MRRPLIGCSVRPDALLRHPTSARGRALRQDGRLLQGRPERDGHHRPPRGARPPQRRGRGRAQGPARAARPPPTAHARHVPLDVLGRLTQRVVVHVDGGARGNPGPAAVGAVVSAEDEVLAEEGEYIGEATNNVAKDRAVLLGLALARSVGARSVEVVNDSELVARQIGGQYKVKNPGLRPLWQDAMAALREFDSWSVTNVPRAMNARADELVNQALDREAG